jgi:hypothetical protein
MCFMNVLCYFTIGNPCNPIDYNIGSIANGAIESFKKPLTNGLTKICNLDKMDWDDKTPAILWEYRTMYKRFTS